MKFPIFQVDAFTSKLFGGNPAAVIPLKEWISDDNMQLIAAENNLSETAFFVPDENGFGLRWFTPKTEVDLCGHATLAAAHVLFNEMNYEKEEIIFQSKSGALRVTKDNQLLTMNFPSVRSEKVHAADDLLQALGNDDALEILKSDDYLILFNSEMEVANLKPDFTALNKIDARGIIVTAKGDKADFVSRFFAPNVGINEDPVTGSAHTKLIPYWSEKLNKNELTGFQISERGGELFCKMIGDRVEISGNAVTYLKGEIYVA